MIIKKVQEVYNTVEMSYSKKKTIKHKSMYFNFYYLSVSF